MASRPAVVPGCGMQGASVMSARGVGVWAAAAWAAGKFDAELVKVPVPQKKGDPVLFDRDEGVRGDTTVESLAKLKPLMADGVTTAGNASASWMGSMAGTCEIVGDIVGTFVDPDDWDALRE